MQVTDAMIDAAIKKAIEAGWIPKNALLANHDTVDIMRGILQAALDVMRAERRPLHSGQRQRHAPNC